MHLEHALEIVSFSVSKDMWAVFLRERKDKSEGKTKIRFTKTG